MSIQGYNGPYSAGRSISLDCSVGRAKPAVETLTWFRNGVEIEGYTGTTLGIGLSKKVDGSTVACSATSPLGTSRSEDLVLEVWCEYMSSDECIIQSGMQLNNEMMNNTLHIVHIHSGRTS